MGMVDAPGRRASVRSSSKKRSRSEDTNELPAVSRRQDNKKATERSAASAKAVAGPVPGATQSQQPPAAIEAVQQEQNSMNDAIGVPKPRGTRSRRATRQQQGISAPSEAATAAGDEVETPQQQQQTAEQALQVLKPTRRSSRRSGQAGQPAVVAATAVDVDQSVPTAAVAEDETQFRAVEAEAAPVRSSRSKALARKLQPANSNSSKGKSSSGSGPTRAAEQRLWQQGYKLVAGVDEAGRGPLAGPVVAAACILPPDIDLPGLNDSKQMSEEARERLYDVLTTHPDITYAVSVVDHETIDEINILQAAMLAMQQAVEGLSTQPDHVLIDGNRRPKGLREDMPAQLLVKGDATSTCIAAASVIAKVTRDRLMLELDQQYPQYGFAQHKGYGVPAHRAAIHEHGPCAVHRRSFEPVKSMVGFAGYGQKAAAAAAVEKAAAAAMGEPVAASDRILEAAAVSTPAVVAAAAAAEGVVAATATMATAMAAGTVLGAAAAAGSSAISSLDGVLSEVQPSTAKGRQPKKGKAVAAGRNARSKKEVAVAGVVSEPAVEVAAS